MNTTTTPRRTYESLSEAAARTGLSIKTLGRRIARGELTTYRSARIIRLDPNDVDRLLARLGSGANDEVGHGHFGGGSHPFRGTYRRLPPRPCLGQM